ncbi:MAG: hypothetical protein ABSD97_13285, partial [Acidimicrobiales bacterium]
VNELTGAGFEIPVLNYAELAGLLLGWDPYEVVGIQGHTVPVEPLLDRIGIPRPSRLAYLREDSDDTGRPEQVAVAARLAQGSGAR